MTRLPNPPDGFEDLCRMSARFGSDPLHIQGAGGNSSIKSGGVMWIKASGTLLADAQTKEVFVATDLAGMRAALEAEDPVADRPAAFLLPGGSDLRPSIETSLHAVFPHAVVLHTHCIHTLALAVRRDARERLAERLDGFAWAFVDYAKPGADLARGVRAALQGDTNVVVLGNHGLIVAGETVEEVEALQIRVHDALACDPCRAPMQPRLDDLIERVEGTEYGLPHDPFLHHLALDAGRVTQVTTGSLYPDHVIFCGVAVAGLKSDETVVQGIRRVQESGAPAPIWFIVPDAGVIVRQDAGTPALAMMRCLADVMARVPGDVALSYLSLDQNRDLLDWDAEKYRQKLNAS